MILLELVFAREYIVFTESHENVKLSLGIGWGKFVGDNSFENPLSFISDKLISRPVINDKYGGKPSYNQWFRGESSLFGGFEFTIPRAKKLKLKLELDPFNYFDFSANNKSEASYKRRKKDSNLNIGLSYPLNKFLTLDTSYIKGNSVVFNLSFGTTFNNKLFEKKSFNPEVKKVSSKKSEKKAFYDDLLHNLNTNRLYLQTANLDHENNLEISIATSEYRNNIRSSAYAAYFNKAAELNNIDLLTYKFRILMPSST